MSSNPDVDVVIPVHDPRRPISRAVGSILDHNRAAFRVTVVCHNTPAAGIRAGLAGHADDPRLRLLELHDGIHSPTGPFNLGLDSATARFTSVMGSDDELEPGAIDSWLALADRDHAAVVVPRLRHAGGRDVPTPPVRPGRRRNLDGVKDRLSYRSAPLGLVSTQEFGAERFVAGLGSGEDVAYVTAVWFGGRPISFDRHGPAYLIHSDAGDRVTMGVKPVSADVAFMRLLVEDSRFANLSAGQRLALVIKLLRIHIFGIVTNRPSPAGWTQSDRLDLAEMTRTLLAVAPAAAGILSRADGRLLDAIQDPTASTQRLIDLGQARRHFARPGSLLPGDLRHLFSREAPLRMITASALVRGLR